MNIATSENSPNSHDHNFGVLRNVETIVLVWRVVKVITVTKLNIVSENIMSKMVHERRSNLK